MDRERWQQVDRIFTSAVGRPIADRAALLDDACAGDEELRREVESLIAHDEARSFMKFPASAEAARLIFKDREVIGHTIRAYKIQKALGAGGMGEVYLAHDTRLNRPAALKLLSAHLTTDEEHVVRFRQEALAASALNHPNIITIYEIGNTSGGDFIATEFVDGVTLRGRMRGRGLRLADALDIAIQIASAMAAAHQAGIVHRDIKPENVMVRPDGLVKVLDFGIAKYAQTSHHRRDAKEALFKTTPGAVVGTVTYMSPEQARGLEVDARTDIWSLGVILYEMIARQPPFIGTTASDRIAAILEREPEPLSKRSRGISPELESVVRRALAKDKDKRYARATELAAALRKLRAALGNERPSRFVLPTPVAGLSIFPGTRQIIAFVASFLLLAALIVAGLSYRGSGADGSAIDSLAILPLVNANGTADTDYLSDGITEGLINSLSRVSDLRVMARTTVFRYKGRDADPQKVGRELGVSAVLTGKLLTRGDDLIIQADLVNVADGSQLWGEQYNRKLTQLVAVQNEIAREVSRKLRARLSDADEQRLLKDYTANAEAYQHYLKGRHHVLKMIPSEIQKGISYFQQAIEIEPSYALAYVGLATAYRTLTLTGEMSSAKFFPLAKVAVQKAIEIDDTLAEAHAESSLLNSWYDWDWNEAEIQGRRALELNPKSADAHLAYGRLLCVTGRHAEGLAEIRRARELEPLNLRINTVEGEFLIHAGQTDEALTRLQRTLELDPKFWFAQMFIASAYIEKRMFTEAIAAARKAQEISDTSNQSKAYEAYASAKSGKRAAARAALEELLNSSTKHYIPPYHIAMIYNGLDERAEALAWLERGYAQREPKMSLLKGEPKWNNLRDEPRFQDLMRRLGFEP